MFLQKECMVDIESLKNGDNWEDKTKYVFNTNTQRPLQVLEECVHPHGGKSVSHWWEMASWLLEPIKVISSHYSIKHEEQKGQE